MSWRQWAIPRTGTDAVWTALIVAGSLLFSDYVAAGHHRCHDAGHEACSVCLYVCSLSYLPNIAPPPAIAVVERRSVRPRVLRPISVRLIVVAPRAPPDQLV